MDRKQRKCTNNDNIGSSDDESSVSPQTSRVDNAQDNDEIAFYSDHINSVCNALNYEVNNKQTSPSEQMMIEKRREINRQNARKRRRRRRDEIERVEVELRRLEAESAALAAEKVALEAELQVEVSMTLAESSLQTYGLQRPVRSAQFTHQDESVLIQQLLLQQQPQQQRRPQVSDTTAAFSPPIVSLSHVLASPSARLHTASRSPRPSPQESGYDFAVLQREPIGLGAEMQSVLFPWQGHSHPSRVGTTLQDLLAMTNSVHGSNPRQPFASTSQLDALEQVRHVELAAAIVTLASHGHDPREPTQGPAVAGNNIPMAAMIDSAPARRSTHTANMTKTAKRKRKR